MSMSYYKLRHPVTRLDMVYDYDQGISAVEVWTFGTFAGRLLFEGPEQEELLRFFADDGEPVAVTSWGGFSRGCVVDDRKLLEPDTLQVISEQGELLTLGEVRSYNGKGPNEPSWEKLPPWERK